MDKLSTSKRFTGPRGPVVLAVLDGIGIGRHAEGDIVRAAHTPTMDWLRRNALASQLKAHGRAVGMPSDGDMGNSEVGHNAIGCGRVFQQGAALVSEAIASGALFEGKVWCDLIGRVRDNATCLHLIGLLSDGNVHSHIDHLEALLAAAARTGVRRARVHALLDGRDVPSTSALIYVDRLEDLLGRLNRAHGVDYRIASGGGRMQITMDRYEADWQMVARGWQTHVAGKGRGFASCREAIETFRRELPGVIDQDLPAFVVLDGGQPVGPVRDGDSVICFNFRGDRAIELSKAFEEKDFRHFERDPMPAVAYAGMMQYDGDALIPKQYLVNPPGIDRTLGEYLAKTGVRQLAISETQKFGHVTYFFNGNRTGKFDEKLEDYIEIPSDQVPFEQRPWMKAAQITDRVLQALQEEKYGFIRLNFANGDMVGHTGIIEAVRIAVETVDLCLGRLVAAIQKTQGVLIVSADHGNADDMLERDKKTGQVMVDAETGKPKTKTAHSLNPVPVFVYDPHQRLPLRLSAAQDLGISSLAATVLVLLGFEPPADYTPSIVTVAYPP
jgi:2,3-bisphosphoglycerate-independent phosphoglycerate mutase